MATQGRLRLWLAEGGYLSGFPSLLTKLPPRNFLNMSELVFEVVQEGDGGFCAECLSDTIVTEGDTWEELRGNAQEVVRAFYFDQPEKLPASIRLHLVRDEVLAVA
jgi:predicted RNase H-like HicB family nuclease